MRYQNVIHQIEIPAQDFTTSRRFYEDLLRVCMRRYDTIQGEVGVFPGNADYPGAMAILMETPAPPANSPNGPIIYFHCHDLTPLLQRAQALGATILLPKTSRQVHGYVGHILDPSGNRIGLHSYR